MKRSVQNCKKDALVGYTLKRKMQQQKFRNKHIFIDLSTAIDTLKILLDFWADKSLFFKLFRGNLYGESKWLKIRVLRSWLKFVRYKFNTGKNPKKVVGIYVFGGNP